MAHGVAPRYQAREKNKGGLMKDEQLRKSRELVKESRRLIEEIKVILRR